jgi:alpha-tubulin suppressor-like RCC1 family protein
MNIEVAFSSTSGHMTFLGRDNKLYTWGNNGCYDLGQGFAHDNVHTIFPLTLPPDPLGRPPKLKALALAQNHTLALTEDSRLLYWGWELEDWTRGRRKEDHYQNKTPQFMEISDITSEKIIQISCGAFFSAFLTESGSVFTWGTNAHGQLGHGDKNSRLRPTRISLEVPVSRLACGHSHVLAFTRDGVLLAWGSNTNGELALPDLQPRLVPTLVSVLPPGSLVSLSCSYFNLGITKEGNVLKWGWTFNPETGIYVTPVPLPLDFGGRRVVQVACGGGHSLALMEGGRVVGAWGRNDFGQLGDGTTEERKGEAVLLDLGEIQARRGKEEGEGKGKDEAGSRIVAIGCGNDSSYFITNQGELFVWGHKSCSWANFAEREKRGRGGEGEDGDREEEEEGGDGEELSVLVPRELVKGWKVRVPMDVLWDVVEWIFLGKVDENSIIFGMPLEIIYNIIEILGA